MSKKPSLKVGDAVRPWPEWLGDPNRVPSGRVHSVESWGTDCVARVGQGCRAFAAYVFERAPR